MIRKTVLLFCLLSQLLVNAQRDSILSGVYDWKQPVATKEKNIKTAVLFEGVVHDMEWLKVSANELVFSNTNNKMTVPANEEHLYIVKNGTLNININDSGNDLVGGSIALLMPGESFFLQNKNTEPCGYYVMKYRSRLPMDMDRGKKAGGSFVKDWNKIEFKPHDRGGIRNYFERATAMSKRFEMHVTTLKGSIKSHEPHTHRAEEIVLMIEGNTEMQIGQQFYQGKNGSVFYLGSNVSHAIRNKNTEPCMYFAFQFE